MSLPETFLCAAPGKLTIPLVELPSARESLVLNVRDYCPLLRPRKKKTSQGRNALSSLDGRARTATFHYSPYNVRCFITSVIWTPPTPSETSRHVQKTYCEAWASSQEGLPMPNVRCRAHISPPRSPRSRLWRVAKRVTVRSPLETTFLCAFC